ncbi:MAG: acetylxylan esterase [Cyclobacteriaceae bacterium]
MKRLFALCLFSFVCFSSFAQWSQAERDSLYRLAKEDHEQMKQQLGIKMPNRPGPSGNPSDPNAANSDESKVVSYVLPDPLVFNDGRQVKSAQDWLARSREIKDLFSTEMYGYVPENVPSVSWQVVNEKDTLAGKYPVRETILHGVVDNTKYPALRVEIEVLIVVPADQAAPVPLVIHLGSLRQFAFGNQIPEPESFLFSRHEPDWKLQLISNAWAYAIISPSSIQPDNGAGLRTGIIGLTNQGKHRKPDQWGALRAWAWGVSRLLDHLETHDEIDAERIAIEGLSRYGKAALVAMAYEPRISLGFIGSSGAGGAKILRRNFGEQIENLTGVGEYHWFCGNFLKYGSAMNVSDLPVDAHELIALCAPRPVFISAGSPYEEGNWVDAKGMFLAGVHAGPVYRLLGREALETDHFPPLGMPVVHGEIAWRQHAGGHSTGPNWSTWIGWAHRYWR